MRKSNWKYYWRMMIFDRREKDENEGGWLHQEEGLCRPGRMRIFKFTGVYSAEYICNIFS